MKKFVTLMCIAYLWTVSSLGYTAEQDLHEDVLSPNPALSLREILDKCINRNPQQYQLSAEAFQVNTRKAMAESWLPNAPAVSLFHQDDTFASARNERDWQVFLEVPIWLPKQRLYRSKVAELSLQDLDSSRESVKLKVAGSLRDALWDIEMNSKQVVLAKQRITLASQLELDVDKKFKAGELAKTDLMLIQQERMQAERQLLLVEAELMHARHRYILLTGLNEMPAQIEEAISSKADFEQSPIWLAAQSKVNLAQGERELVESEKRENPQVMFNARTSQGAFDTQYNQSFGFTVRIPLDNPGRSGPLQSQAEKQIANAMTDRENLRLAMLADLHEAEHNLNTTKLELDIATRQLEMSREQARLAKKAFTLGESDLTTVLRIQSQAFEVEHTVALRQTQYQWNIARYNQAVGVLP
jgi:cobalt-zinc-cadmium efflux system outer membrane protein